MPIAPSTYFPGPVSPQQLNADLFSFDGTGAGANGILFHSHRPLLSESLVTSGTAYTAVSQQPVAGPAAKGYSVIDTTALFCLGADRPGTYAIYEFANRVPGSGGVAGSAGGWWLNWGFPFTSVIANPPGGVGAGVIEGTTYTTGIFQYGCTNHNNCPWYLNLNAVGNVIAWSPAFWWEAPGSPNLQVNAIDSSGQVTRMGFLWQGVTTGGSTVATIPVPVMSWGTVTSAALNNNIGSVFTFLNNVPMVKAEANSSLSVTNNANTIVGFRNSPVVDTYRGWSTAASNYTPPFKGLYLFSPLLAWGTSSSAGVRWTGLQVTSGGTTYTYQGPSYKATPVGEGVSGVGLTITSLVRILSLNAGDKVAAYGFQNSGAALALDSNMASRFTGLFMSQIAPAGSVYTLPAPVTSFRWQAGALSGTALTAALNQHLGTDLQFLMNKPYFTGYQSSAQNFGTVSGFHVINIDTVGAPPQGGNGDNYGGWSAANHWYASQLAGWYLCIFDGYASPPASGTAGVLVGAFNVSSSGTIQPLTAPDQYQQVFYPVSTGGPPPGATAVGLYYLAPGETIQPMMEAISWGGTFGTFVQNGTANVVNSQFSCFWVAE